MPGIAKYSATALLACSLALAQFALVTPTYAQEASNNVMERSQASEVSAEESARLVVAVILGLLGIIFVIAVLAGGVQWVTAGGQSDNISRAKRTVAAGIIGLLVILSSYIVAGFIISALSRANI